jgi:hypothetical protein
MDRRADYRRKSAVLLALIATAALYSSWFAARHAVTGSPTFDGALSVVLGLYICSRPAGNAIDLLFYDRGSFRFSQWNSLRWLALNILTLFMGWLVIYLGTTHLTSQTE